MLTTTPPPLQVNYKYTRIINEQSVSVTLCSQKYKVSDNTIAVTSLLVHAQFLLSTATTCPYRLRAPPPPLLLIVAQV
jgi:hypothetical protein